MSSVVLTELFLHPYQQIMKDDGVDVVEEKSEIQEKRRLNLWGKCQEDNLMSYQKVLW